MNGGHRWAAALLALATAALLAACADSEDSNTAAFCKVYDETNGALARAMEPGPDFASLDEEARRADLAARLDRVQEIHRQRQAAAPENLRDDFQVLIDGLELGSRPQDPPDEQAKRRVDAANEHILQTLRDECGIRLPPTTAG